MLLLLFRPFGGSGPIPPPPEPVVVPSGVRKRKRELIVNIKDVVDKQSTADFLKAQLNLRHPQSPFVQVDEKKQKKVIAEQRRREKEMRDSLEERKRIQENNERAIMLAMIIAEMDDL